MLMTIYICTQQSLIEWSPPWDRKKHTKNCNLWLWFCRKKASYCYSVGVGVICTIVPACYNVMCKLETN